MNNSYNIDKKLILFLILFCGILNAKSYTIDSLWIDSKVSTDGSVSISETRNFSFSGSYSYAYLELRKKYFDSIYDIQVFENDNIYELADTSGKVSTYIVEEKKRIYRIKWFFEAQDEERIFTVTYKVDGALRVGQSDAELYWPYLYKGRNKKISSVFISQSFDEQIYNEDFWYTVKGLSKKKFFAQFNDGKLIIEANNVSKNRKLYVQSIFPRYYLNDVPINDQYFSLANALEKVRKREIGVKYGFYIVIVFLLISVSYTILRYNRYGKAYNISPEINDQGIKLPSDHHPAIISYFISNYPMLTGHAVLATIFRLANMGRFRIEEAMVTKTSFFTKKKKEEWKIVLKKNDLKNNESIDKWDLQLWHLINKEFKDGILYMDELFKKIRDSYSFQREWGKTIGAMVESNSWIEKPPVQDNLRFLFFHIFLSILCLLFFQYLPPLSIISAIIFVVIGLAGGFGISRMSVSSRKMKVSWENLENDIKSKKYIVPNDMDKNYLLQCCLVTGVENYEMKQLLKNFNYGKDSELYWFVGLEGSLTLMQSFSTMLEYGGDMSVMMAAGGDGGAGGGGGGGGGGAG